MSETTIAWTERTWNPVRGCSRISPGCVNCYAERMAARNLPGMAHNSEPFAIMQPSGPRWTGRVELIPHMLDVPLKRRKPTTYFVNSMSDLFHESLPDEAIDRVFAVMALCPQHTFQVLTKRAKRMREYMESRCAMLCGGSEFFESAIADAMRHVSALDGHPLPGNAPLVLLNAGDWQNPKRGWPPPNVWFGVSVEDQQRADERIPELLATPAAVRFISAEPLLGPVDLGLYLRKRCTSCKELHGSRWPHDSCFRCNSPILPGLDWVIVGGESGPGARPCDVAWIRSIVQECKTAGVACFVKQLGAKPFSIVDHISHKGCTAKMPDGFYRYVNDPKGGDPDEWPEDLRVREMPR